MPIRVLIRSTPDPGFLENFFWTKSGSPNACIQSESLRANIEGNFVTNRAMDMIPCYYILVVRIICNNYAYFAGK